MAECYYDDVIMAECYYDDVIMAECYYDDVIMKIQYNISTHIVTNYSNTKYYLHKVDTKIQ